MHFILRASLLSIPLAFLFFSSPMLSGANSAPSEVEYIQCGHGGGHHHRHHDGKHHRGHGGHQKHHDRGHNGHHSGGHHDGGHHSHGHR